MTTSVGAIHESPVSFSCETKVRAIRELLLRGLLGLIALSFINACSPITQTDARYFYFGTVIEIRLYNEHDPKNVLTEIESNLKQWHQRFHAWQPSELTQLNAALQRGEAVIPAPDLAYIIKRSQILAEQSDQLFNPALGKQFAAWGFARDNMNAPAPAPPNVDAKTLPSMRDLVWQDEQLKSLHPDLQLDLGGIAKGYALEQIMNMLREHGFSNAMINIGGDIGVLGQTPERPWHIAIQNPNGDKTPLATLTLNDGEMAFTSGIYARQHKTENGSAHHIIDPRTGKPAQGNIAVTLVGRNGMLLQAMCKAILIAGKQWPEMAKRGKLARVLVLNPNEKIELSNMMLEKLNEQRPDRFTIISIN